MNVNFLCELFDYQIFEDHRVWDEAIMPLDEALFAHDTGYSWGSLQRECMHVVNILKVSLQRAQNDPDLTFPYSMDEKPNRAAVRTIWDALEAQWTDYLAQMDEREFNTMRRILYRNKHVEIPVWNIVFQMINHGTIHRVEMLKMVAKIDEPVKFDLSLMQYWMRD